MVVMLVTGKTRNGVLYFAIVVTVIGTGGNGGDDVGGT